MNRMKFLRHFSTFKAKSTVLFALYIAVALVILSGMIVHLQKANFTIMAREDAKLAIYELSTTIRNKWKPVRTAKENRWELRSYAALSQMIGRNDNIVYALFQDTTGAVQYTGKSIPEFVWMARHSQLDETTRRMLAVTGEATRSFASYPEGRVLEYMSVVYDKDKKPLGYVRVGISERNVKASMGRMTRDTVLKILAVNVIVLLCLILLVFYATSSFELRLRKIQLKAHRMLERPMPEQEEPQNVLQQLSYEFEEIEHMVSSLKNKFMELATTISHEFRSPMQAIAGYVDFLRMGGAGAVNPEMDKYLKIIGENAERFQGFIDNVMDLVRLDGGTLKLSLAPFKPAEVVNRTVELFANQASEHGIRFKTSIAEQDLQVYGDSSRVFQILVNLVSNSLKFTPQGGEIELGVRRNGIAAEFFVRDTGCGIPEGKQFKLFTEFYQIAEAEPLRGFKGLGIGLALCKKLVQAQGGFISLSSRSGHGTTVAFQLPQSGFAAPVGAQSK